MLPQCRAYNTGVFLSPWRNLYPGSQQFLHKRTNIKDSFSGLFWDLPKCCSTTLQMGVVSLAQATFMFAAPLFSPTQNQQLHFDRKPSGCFLSCHNHLPLKSHCTSPASSEVQTTSWEDLKQICKQEWHLCFGTKLILALTKTSFF